MTTTLFVPLEDLIGQAWPKDLLDPPSVDALHGIWMEPPDIERDPHLKVETAILFETELAVGIPGLDAVRLIFAPNGSSTAFGFQIDTEPVSKLSILDIPIALRLESSLLKPARRVHAAEPGKPDTFEQDPSTDHVDITLGNVTLSLDVDGNIAVSGAANISLPPSFIGDTGVVVEASQVGVFLDSNTPPPGKPAGWRGVHIGHAAVYLPGELAGIVGNLELADGYIGNGGFSGTVSDTWTPTLSAQFFGMPFTLQHAEVKFVQNALSAAAITGRMNLPFFDAPVDVEISLKLNGGFAVKMASTNGLYTLTKQGILSMELESLGFEVKGSIFTAKMSGKLTPLFGGLDWPSFQVKELLIDSDGNVHLEGGWLNLREKYSLDFYGFQLEISKLGFGKTDDGGKWIGFSGSLKLVDGLPAGASVEGLRIIWYNDGNARITLNGVGVEFEVPDVLRFKGAVSYRELPGNVHRFDGDIKLELLTLDLEVDATLVIGYDNDKHYSFFAIYLGVDLPAGIPLWSTGIALYGMAGLFALEMEPDKSLPEHANEEWYENLDGKTPGWYKRPEEGVTDLSKKWTNREGSLGLGAGITIGTVADNGFTFSGKMLFVIVFPGPILLIEGRANVLKERSSLGDNPVFRALAVLDGRAGTFLVGVSAQYKYGDGGELIEIGGSVEAFFSFTDPSKWHLYLGQKEPREKRIRAAFIYHLFESSSYWMLDATKLQTGSWVGWQAHWSFGPLGVTAEAWIESNVVVSWKPVYFHGDLWLHGKAALKIFWFSFGLSLDARLAGDVFDPFHLLAELKVGVDLPWFLPDFDVTITLEWGPEPEKPLLPLPLKEIAVEHFKVSTSWPLPRGQLLLPVYDGDADGFREDSDRDGIPEDPGGISEPADWKALPVVPLDGRPHITFGRSMHDDALVSINPQPIWPDSKPEAGWEWIGNPEANEGPVRTRYGLKEVALEKQVGASWVQVARKAAVRNPNPQPNQPKWIVEANPVGVEDLFGSWAPIPQLPSGDVAPGADPPVAQTKLQLWSKTPFDYTRHGGRAWDEWFTDRFTEYPCIPIPPDQEICYDFERLDPGSQLFAPWAHPEEPKLIFSWLAPDVQTVTVLQVPVKGRTHALCFPSKALLPYGGTQPNLIHIDLPQPAKAVRILVVDKEGVEVTGYNEVGTAYGPVYGGKSDNPEVVVTGDGIVRVVVRGYFHTCVLAVCLVVGPDPEEVLLRQEMAQHLVDEMARWSQEGEVLEPHTTYRLKVVTTIEAKGEKELSGYSPPIFEQTEFAYFRTEGPPGLTLLSTPIGHPKPDEFKSGLDDLTRYVHQTVPATVPAAGEKPPLPRPVYRAYDVGVEFTPDAKYVDLMYRLDRRDLGLYLYDNNNRPVRDAQGRLIVLTNRWGVTDDLMLTESELRWIITVNASTCAVLDTTLIPHNKTLTSAADGQVLDPDTVYEARLVPLLLHEDFGTLALGAKVIGSAGSLDRWVAEDQGNLSRPSHWEIRETGVPPSRYVIQTSSITSYWIDMLTGQPLDSPELPGTLLLRADNSALPPSHLEQPGNWSHYRLSVYLRSEDDGAIGVVFRYRDDRHYYQFSMDSQRKCRRLVRVVQGVPTILAEDDFVYRLNQDYLITVEAIGTSLRIYQDGTLTFDVTDDSIDQGRIGLYCSGNTGARFSDVRVDDFRQGAPVVYRFQFTTSQFANFFHQLHSFQDETWVVELPAGAPPDADIAALVAAGALPNDTPSEAEARAYDTLAEHVLGSGARQNPPQVQVTRVERAGAALALLVQSPEPIDWKRTKLEVLRAERRAPQPELPTAVKLTDITLGASQPNEESLSLLLREATDLTRHRIEYHRLPGPLAEPTGDPILFLDEFDGDGGLLFRETFGPNSLDHYTIVDEGKNLGPPAWAVSGGHIVQTSNIYGGSVSGSVPDKPGTIAFTGSATWTNVCIRATFRSEDDGAIGIVFRYKDADNYYRFSMDRERGYRRLVRKTGSQAKLSKETRKVPGIGAVPRSASMVAASFVTVLWEDNVAYDLSESCELVIEAYQDRLVGYLDNTLLFSVRDPAIGAGQVGLYTWANAGAHFEALEVEALESDPVLWQPSFDDLSEITIVDEPGAVYGPSQWDVGRGVLTQSSNLHVIDSSPHRPGTYALGGAPSWRDVQISVRLRSEDDDAIGVMFRYMDGDSYYRFSMDSQHGYRRLIKKVGGAVTVLWQDRVRYTVGQSYELTLRAAGNELRGYLDGLPLFTVNDSDLNCGRVGLYCWANMSAHFERVLVTDATRWVGRWTIHDEGTVNAPSVWRMAGGAMLQTADIYGGFQVSADPDKPGTQVVTGSLTWADYRLTARIRSDDDDAIGLLFRYVDDDNYYRLSLDAQRDYRRLVKVEDGVVTSLWEQAEGYLVGEPFTLTVDAIGSRLVGYLGDVRLFEVQDATHPTGQVGLYCWENNGARFERVEVRRPPLEAYALLYDRFAAGDTSGWSFIDEGTVSSPSAWSTYQGALRQTSNIYTPPDDGATLSKQGTQAIAGDLAWTDTIIHVRLQSLDNDAIGLLFRFSDANHYYRFSMDSQRGYRRLAKNVAGNFTSLWEDNVAYEVGRTYELMVAALGSTLRGYMDGVPMFVVEDSDLSAGRIGLYCWANQDARFSDMHVYPADLAFGDWLLDEPFDFLITSRWTFVDDGDQQGPSQWKVIDGELQQSSNIYGGSTDGNVLDKPGTYALAGDMAWTDYRVSVRLRSEDDDAIGVMFRYKDADNYYRFSMDAERHYRRLIKKVNGAISVLWEDAVPYILGREYVLTLDCVGERLSGYLDAMPMFSVEDGDLGDGRIGLYCWANVGARFREVRVAAPARVPYYTFECEERLPAGARVRVFAGNQADAPPVEPNIVRRFVASLDEAGRIRLPVDGADLRVRAPGSTEGHGRRFLPDKAYTAVDARILRKADGTGFLLVVPQVSSVGSQLTAGQYRLKLTYRRDNHASDPSSQVFTQVGDSGAENVVVDFPW
jgi:hypothetical protein